MTCEYVYGLERISQERSGVKSTYITDGQGSIRQITDNSGTVSDTYDYFAFGEILNRTGSTENEFQYVGEQLDPNTHFYYLRARWMNPSSGRFISSDRYWVDPSIYIGDKNRIIQNLFGWDDCIGCCSDCGKQKKNNIARYSIRRLNCKMCDVPNNLNVNDPILERVVEAARFNSPSVNCYLNRYLYANASPTNWSDPKGELALPNLAAAWLITGILASVAIVHYDNLLKGREYLGVEPPGTFKPMEPADLIPQVECFARDGRRMSKCGRIASPIFQGLCIA